MLSYIIPILTVILAIFGTLVEPRTKKGKIKLIAYLIVIFIVLLAIAQFFKEHSDKKRERNKELVEIKQEQQKQNILLNQLINNSEPITKFSFYYEFTIDTSLQEVKSIIKQRRSELIKSSKNKISEFGFNIPLEEKKYCSTNNILLSTIGNSTFFSLEIKSKDSLSLQFQSGYPTPQKWYNIELMVTKNDYATLRFTDLQPSIISSDLGFNSLFQLKNSSFKLTPNISNENKKLLISLLSIKLKNEEGNIISSVKTEKRIDKYGITTFEGRLN